MRVVGWGTGIKAGNYKAQPIAMADLEFTRLVGFWYIQADLIRIAG
jgi:hypothetical protein